MDQRISDMMSHKDWIDDEEIDLKMIMEVWNDVTNELFVLLLDSFNRLRSTTKYTDLDLPMAYS